MDEIDGTEIVDTAVPNEISFNADEALDNPVEAAMAALEAEGAKFGDDEDAPEPEEAKEEKENPKKEEKADKPEKSSKDRDESGKFKAKEPEVAEDESAEEPSEADDEEAGEEGEQERSSEERDIDKPPSRFLPRAKEKWASVDPDVRGEVYRAFSEMEKGLEQSREDREFRKSIRQYEEMAKNAGTTVDAAMANYTRIDKELRENPENGIKQVLATLNLTPEQYATHILKQAQFRQQNPDAAKASDYQVQLQQVQQQLEAERQEKARLEKEAKLAAVEREFVDPYRNNPDFPRFNELEQDIAKLLNSDIISFNLPERERLEEAYEMADRIKPIASYNQNIQRLKPASKNRPLNPAGTKSVKGAPGGVVKHSIDTSKLSGAEAISAAMDQIGFR